MHVYVASLPSLSTQMAIIIHSVLSPAFHQSYGHLIFFLLIIICSDYILIAVPSLVSSCSHPLMPYSPPLDLWRKETSSLTIWPQPIRSDETYLIFDILKNTAGTGSIKYRVSNSSVFRKFKMFRMLNHLNIEEFF